MTRVAVLKELAPSSGSSGGKYHPHRLHREEQAWVEKNCYIDIWLEVLHSLGCEPMAVLPFVLGVDFAGDQWVFFKPPHNELFELYGVDVQELNVWRPLLDHSLEFLSQGKLISTEADAFYLPDTSGTDYNEKHTKTTIVINDIDVEAKKLGYFHNAGYHQLEGDDFDQTFRVGKPYDPSYMPLYAESISIERLVHRSEEDLRRMSKELIKRHLGRRPPTNPIERFRVRFEKDFPGITALGLPYFHAWAFATLRQLGAAFELATRNLQWLSIKGVMFEGSGAAELAKAAEHFDKISQTSKAFILKGARAVNGKKALDASQSFNEMSEAWEQGMKMLVRVSGT